jgi:hypothetical protein
MFYQCGLLDDDHASALFRDQLGQNLLRPASPHPQESFDGSAVHPGQGRLAEGFDSSRDAI